MDIFIKTLTGTIFELRVSPFETILSIKSKLQRLEGIPISQQHLIWRSTELLDEFCSHDYGIKSGATLTMVLAMRDGPINMRRVSVEEPDYQEMNDYINSNAGFDEEIWEKLMSDDKQVTLLVFRDGEQLNFFRVYERSDGTLSPYSEPISPESICNGYTLEEGTGRTKSRLEDNTTTRDKMIALRSQLNDKSVKKKQSKQPRPPSKGKPGSKLARRRINFTKQPPQTTSALSRHSVIPKTESKLEIFEGTPSPEKLGGQQLNFSRTESSSKRPTLPPVQKGKDSAKIDVSEFTSNNVEGRKTASSYQSNVAECATEHSFPMVERENSILRTYKKFPSLTADKTSHDSKDSISHGRHRILKPIGKLERNDNNSSVRTPSTTTAATEPTTQLSHLLRESIEYDNYKKLLNWVQPKSSHGNRDQNKPPSRGRGRNTPTHSAAKIHPHGNLSHLPSVHHTSEKRHPPSLTGKKKTRCLICTKKLGLATTYLCRCGGKFCATHRYPETHTCTYDYKMEGRKLLEKNNPVVTAPKLPKI